MLPLDSVTALGMAVAELVTNGYRHAFPDDREGTIVVTLASAGIGNAILMIQDDGVGFDTTAATSRRGLGLVGQLVEQIGGTTRVRSEVGTLWTLIFPVSIRAASRLLRSHLARGKPLWLGGPDTTGWPEWEQEVFVRLVGHLDEGDIPQAAIYLTSF